MKKHKHNWRKIGWWFYGTVFKMRICKICHHRILKQPAGEAQGKPGMAGE